MNKQTNNVRFISMDEISQLKDPRIAAQKAVRKHQIDMYNAEVEAAKQWKKSANIAKRYSESQAK